MACLRRLYPFQSFKRLSPTNFTWSILEYFVPNAYWVVIKIKNFRVAK